MNETNTFTETKHTGFVTRLKNALIGILIGLALFIGSFSLIIWNEGRSAKMIQDLKAIKKDVTSVQTNQIDPSFNNKLISITGTITSQGALTENTFGITSDNALRIKTIVEMYQWKEKQDTKSKTNLGGSKTTETTYSYSKKWSRCNKFKYVSQKRVYQP